MDVLNVLLILLSVLLAGGLVYFQYIYKQTNYTDQKIISILRFLSFLGILLLLVNPKFISKSYELIKPKLFIAVDNSESIANIGADQTLREFLKDLKSDKDLNKRFELRQFKFGSALSTDSVLDFQEPQTNIYKAIEDLNTFSNEQRAPIVLLTDGNQTYGTSYAYVNSNYSVFPIVLGDTLPESDVSISLVNINAYATLNNNFSTEVFLVAKGIDELQSDLTIEKDGKIVYKTGVDFSQGKSSQMIDFKLPADKIGMQLFTAKVSSFEGETNRANNVYNFGIEVIDEKTKVALIHDITHPDLGMIKRSIESNEQRQVVIMSTDDFKRRQERFSIHILYQPSNSFKEIFDELHQEDQSYFIITGTHTDWGFLNAAQNAFTRKYGNVSEMFYPFYKNEFNTFYVPEIGFESFPPLRGKFGEIQFKIPHDPILNQEINGILTSGPLLTTYMETNSRRVALFGENLWKWRQYSFKENQSFEEFDQFFSSLLQYLHLSDRKKEMDLIYNPVYYANEPVSIKAKNYDSNLNIDKNSNLVIKLGNDSEKIPLHFRGTIYEAVIDGLSPGKYKFEVEDLNSKKRRSGSFLVASYSMEQESVTANLEDLRYLARHNKGQVFAPNNFKALKDTLLDHPDFKIFEKEKIKMISLIDWKWLLVLIVLSLSLEWFIRKYRGMI